MIITCENCRAKYMVPPNALGKEGRSVKCAKCFHTWFAKPTLEEIEKSKHAVEPPKASVSHDQTKLPTIPVSKYFIIFKILPPIFTLIIIFLVGLFYQNIATVIPGTERLYLSAGAFKTNGVIFKNFAIRKVETITGRDLLIRGQIYNNSYSNKIIPNIRFVIYNLHGEEIKSFIEPPQHDVILKPGDFYSVNFTINQLDDNSEIIKLDLANNLDLILR